MRLEASRKGGTHKRAKGEQRNSDDRGLAQKKKKKGKPLQYFQLVIMEKLMPPVCHLSTLQLLLLMKVPDSSLGSSMNVLRGRDICVNYSAENIHENGLNKIGNCLLG